MSQIRIVQQGQKPQLPPLISVSAITLLMPSLLFLVNFPTIINAVAVVGITVAVFLDRVSLRATIAKEHAVSQELLKEYLKQVEAVAESPRVPKNKDGETLQ